MAASEIARELGLICTFMPKPFSNRTGSGTHMHISIGDAKHKNLFHDDERQARAGPVEARPINSSAGCWRMRRRSPRCARRRSIRTSAWSSAARCPAPRGRRRTSPTATTTAPRWCASRTAGSNCGCPTARAIRISRPPAIIAAGLDGIERKLDPGEPQQHQSLRPDARANCAEQGIADAAAEPATKRIDALAGRQRVCATRSARTLAHEFIRLKRMEWVEYSRHVSDWETNRYLEFF